MVIERKILVISVDVEEWVHSNWFNLKKLGYHYTNFPSDLELTIKKLLCLFDEHSVSATFFTLLDACKDHPEVIESLVRTHHEIALHGIEHKGITSLGEEEFQRQIVNGKDELESLIGSKVLGYRAPNMEISIKALEILSDQGFRYDSSVVSCLKIPGWYGWPRAPIHPYRPLLQHDKNLKEKGIIEFPIAVFPVLRIPGGGGWYLRNFGLHWVKLTLRALLKTTGFAVFYIHPWEISNNNLDLPGIPFHVFRRTGNWTLKALNSILNTFKGEVLFKSFKECLD